MTLITEMNDEEAKKFFLKHESYCNFSLPIYFDFEQLLETISQSLKEKKIGIKGACNHDGINYTIQTNKDGYYSWRPFELIHPAIYTHLVHEITNSDNWEILLNRFRDFENNQKIFCASLPRQSTNYDTSDNAETVSSWWQDVEQESINKALEFKYLFTTDIANFYPSIYTHSIPWAIYTKEVAKKTRTISNIGNDIDSALRQMHQGQTNGIPQGSALMDFIAELVLGYCDEMLGEKLSSEKIVDYFIIRYRDDYRIFTNSKEEAESIARHLTKILQKELGLQLNASKTSLSEDIILNSMKPDKQEALILFGDNVSATTIQKTLLKLAIFSRKYKNSGQLNKYLAKLNKRLSKMKKLNEEAQPIISIIADIMANNPRTYASCVLVLSNILSFIDKDDEKAKLLTLIKQKFESILGTGILDIWLQRISYHIDLNIKYREPLCDIVMGINDKTHEPIWNSNWITDTNFKDVVMSTPFIDKKKLQNCNPVIPEDEVVLYPYYLLI